ncbi:MAG: DUF5131 family protein [Candidatus Marinimicrobia bacterium]|nr:DUF5131 family protein [Candidatus Neomarinimicrobiota bacterium]
MKNKIGWCDMTWNPVWGCRNYCEYCYARKIAKRFADVIADKEHTYIYKQSQYRVWQGEIANKLRHFVPTFLKSHFNKRFPKNPQRIFVGSMSEIYYWREEWIEKVIEKVKQSPQHTFQFLTRYPEIYDNYIWPKNCWLGVTITREEDKKRGIPYLFITSCNITFVSVEPLLEPVDPVAFSNANIDWVIIGAETGNRKDKVIPKLDWVLEIVRYCEHHKISVYIKDNLTKYYAECRGYKQFPKGVKV